MNISYAMTLLISLYGGLIIILRLVAISLVKIILDFWNRSAHRRIQQNTIRQRLIRSIKTLNLFKDTNARTQDDVKQQKIITYVYLILLTSTFLIIFLFTSLNYEMMIITEEKPSLIKYNVLQSLHSKTLECSCFTMMIPYSTMISLSPTFHQVCQSDFIDQRWIGVLKATKHPYVPFDWRNTAAPQFQLLSDLCKLANATIKNTID